MDNRSSFDALLVALAVNTALTGPIALVAYYPDYGLTLRAVGAFAVAGLVGTGLGWMGYYESIELVDASRAEPVKSSKPLYATSFAVLILGEIVSPIRWVGICVIILDIGVIILDIGVI